jgi:hypothetical protein
VNRHFQKRWKWLLALLLAALTATWAAGAVQDRFEVAKMTEKMKTVCVGRMLIDLPEEAEHRVYGAWISGFDISAIAETPEAFHARMAKREAEIQAKPDRFGGTKNMETVREVKTGSGLVGKIFMHGRNVIEGTQLNGLEEEGYRIEDVTMEAHVHGDGISIEVLAEETSTGRIEALSTLVEQLVANPANQKPVEPGFCLDQAYVRDPLTAKQRERIVMTAGLPSRPDIEIRFDTMAGTKPADKGLLERNEASHARAPAMINMRFTNLRAAPRTIGGMAGEELAERVVEENFAIVYGFEWEMNGSEDNVFIPAMNLTLKTGSGDDGPVRSSLSEHAALALWDKISSSIRVRPAASPTVTVAPASTPLGTLAYAGEVCPETGWWQCGDGSKELGVLGGRRQYIVRGQRTPQALLLPPRTLWDKIQRIQPSFESKNPSAWQLVDRRSRQRAAPLVPLDQPKAGASGVLRDHVSDKPARQAMLGCYATTGSPCPASGWWRSDEPQALDGTRWFAQGSLLPAATFTVPPGVFGTSSDAPKAMQRRAKWQLMRLVEAPEATRAAGYSHG